MASVTPRALHAGLALAIVAGSSKWLAAVIDPFAEFLRPISPIAWIPLAILMFGVGGGVPMFLIFYAAMFPIFVGTLDGIRRVDPSLINAGARARRVALDAGAARDLSRRAAVDFLQRRLSLGVAWMALVAGEIVGGDAGIGWRILWYQEFFQMDRVLAAILIVGALGLAADTLLRSAAAPRASLASRPREGVGTRSSGRLDDADSARHVRVLPLAVALLLCAGWEAAVRVTHTHGLMPSPTGVVESGMALTTSGVIFEAMAGSLKRVMIGFAIGGALGIPPGLAIGTIPGARPRLRGRCSTACARSHRSRGSRWRSCGSACAATRRCSSSPTQPCFLSSSTPASPRAWSIGV